MKRDFPGRMVAVVLVALVTGLGAGTGAGARAPLNQSRQEKADEIARASNLPDANMIDQQITEMLGYWQVGDTAKLHTYFADDVSTVSGLYEPPLLGWGKYLAVYEQQRARTANVLLDRRNTYINVKGDFAWACYQWNFSGIVDGRPATAQGQSTLVFERRDGRWLIVHNHTSEICAVSMAKPAAPPAGRNAPGE